MSIPSIVKSAFLECANLKREVEPINKEDTQVLFQYLADNNFIRKNISDEKLLANSTQVELTEKIISDMAAMENEFLEEKGSITCEFSIQEKYLVAMHRHIFATRGRMVSTPGEWHVYLCETCTQHSAQHPYHVCIKEVE